MIYKCLCTSIAQEDGHKQKKVPYLILGSTYIHLISLLIITSRSFVVSACIVFMIHKYFLIVIQLQTMIVN